MCVMHMGMVYGHDTHIHTGMIHVWYMLRWVMLHVYLDGWIGVYLDTYICSYGHDLRSDIVNVLCT